MGEGRRDRSSRRHRPNIGIDKSSSDTEIARSKVTNRKVKSRTKERWPFLDGLTVDELGRYRRRRIPFQPRDNLGTYQSSDTRENLVTEYRRAFRATSEDSILKILDSPTKRLPVGVQVYAPSNSERQLHETHELWKPDEERVMETVVERSRYESPAVSGGRPALIRRGTSLKRESDEFYANTEYSMYVSHEGNHRAELARRPTSLKMEGDMDTTTEQCSKFIEWLNVSRPELARTTTHLKLEGDLETTTENHEKYVPFVGARRPELLRQNAHLRLEGESMFVPEYTDVFREHDVRDKRLPVFPEHHLKSGGDFSEHTESCQNFGEPKYKDDPIEDLEDEETKQKKQREDEKRRRKEEDMRMLVSKLEDLKGPPMEVPEYKDAYKDFPRERPKLVRPEDEIGRADGTKIHPTPSQPKFHTKIDQDPEYKSIYMDTDRPVYRKPPISLRPSAASSCSHENRSIREFQRHDATSEVRSQYIPYGQIPRVETLRMPANLRLEGDIALQPEYRDAYCIKRESVMSNEPRMHRHRDRSLSASRKRDNNWMNNNGEQFGRINAADEQDAFQVLSTRVHEESIVGKPPPGSRRGSRVLQMQTPTLHKSSHLDITNSSPTLRNRSPSPTYRLQVHNVDDEPRGFSQRKRSPSVQLSERRRSPSPNPGDTHQDTSHRSYSPSFGRSQQHRNTGSDDHAFVVLDNARNSDVTFNRTAANRRKTSIDRNSNNERVPRTPRGGHQRNRTPTNWMPPWYDNTSTI